MRPTVTRERRSGLVGNAGDIIAKWNVEIGAQARVGAVFHSKNACREEMNQGRDEERNAGPKSITERERLVEDSGIVEVANGPQEVA